MALGVHVAPPRGRHDLEALAERLAELARAIRARINMLLAIETEDGPLTKLMKAFREALVHDLDADGFADMYAQTIAYGLLSARIADPKANTADDFAAHMRTNPFLKELMETFLHVGGRRKTGNGLGLDFDELGVSEVVALLDAANMEAVLATSATASPRKIRSSTSTSCSSRSTTPRSGCSEASSTRRVRWSPTSSAPCTSCSRPSSVSPTASPTRRPGARWPSATRASTICPRASKPTDRFVTILDPATGTGTFLVEAIEVIHQDAGRQMEARGHRAEEDPGPLERVRPQAPAAAPARLRADDGPVRHRPCEDRTEAHETGYRFGSERARPDLLTNALEPRAGLLRHASSSMVPALAHEAKAVNDDQAASAVHGGHRQSTVLERRSASLLG